MSLRRVRVGSSNEPKVSAVRSALTAYAPEVEVEGVSVASGVPDQPVGLDEIVRGARNRAVRAGGSGGCDLGVGIEDGLVEIPERVAGGEMQYVNIGCAAITDGERVSIGFSSAFAYPAECSGRAVRGREPIGKLFDRLWADRRRGSSGPLSARTLGNVGKLTLGVLPRADYARHAVLCALVPFLHPDLYGTRGGAP
jgi:inosine/xanthosine triphosphatase